jgi:AcrR family transcriptional regulator
VPGADEVRGRSPAGVSERLPRDAGPGGTGEDAAGRRMVEIQRGRILAAMVEVCAEYGAANVTVAHVVERAGVSRRTFYELYRDREQCFLATFDDGIERASRYVLEDYDPDAKWVARLRLVLTRLLAFLDVEPGTGQLLIVGSLGAGPAALSRRAGAIDRIHAFVQEGSSEAKGVLEPPPLTAEGIVGGVLSVLHARLLDVLAPYAHTDGSPQDCGQASLLELTAPLMSMIVLPYLGSAAARRELARPAPPPPTRQEPLPADPLRDVHMRLTYRTTRVIAVIGAHPGSSNRQVGLAAEMQDQGQISKLLTRLAKLGLIENMPQGMARGARNAWALTAKGRELERAIGEGVA